LEVCFLKILKYSKFPPVAKNLRVAASQSSAERASRIGIFLSLEPLILIIGDKCHDSFKNSYETHWCWISIVPSNGLGGYISPIL
jgi:hypothetical protein